MSNRKIREVATARKPDGLKQLRQCAGITQTAIASIMGVTHGRVHAIENARHVRKSTEARYRQAIEEIVRLLESRRQIVRLVAKGEWAMDKCSVRRHLRGACFSIYGAAMQLTAESRAKGEPAILFASRETHTQSLLASQAVVERAADGHSKDKPIPPRVRKGIITRLEKA